MGELRKLRLGDAENVVTPYTAEDDSIIINQTTKKVKINPEVIATQDDLDDVKDNLNNKADVIISSASGSIAHFEDGAEADAKSVIAHIELVQEGTGDPSPDNVRPISGFTGMDVVRTGKNFSPIANCPLNPNVFWGTSNNAFVSILNSLSNGTYTISLTYEIVTLPASNVVVHGSPYITALVNGSNIPLTRYSIANDSSPTIGKRYRDTGTFSITDNNRGKISNCYLYCDDANSHTGTGRGLYNVIEVQIEFGSTATAYEPYQGETYPITFPTEAGTVYGGYVDVTNGKLVVTHDIYNLREINPNSIVAYDYNGMNGAFFNTVLHKVSTRANGVCNVAPVVATATYSSPQYMWFGVNSKHVFWIGILDALNLDLATFKTWVSAHDIFVTRELATPIEYDITPQQITTLLGTNNIWNDCNGNTDVEYKADTKLYIEQLTKPTEDDMTANANIASGKFFMVGNRLFLSTSAIASGDTINPGTNCTELSLADALNNLN